LRSLTAELHECWALPASGHPQQAAYLNNISKFGPYLKENTTLHHYKDQLVIAV
jgi:hypothetical protein